MRVVMMGTGLFAEPTLEALLAGRHEVAGLVTQPDRAVGQERGSTRQTGRGMKVIAQEHHVPVYQPESVNTPEGVAALAAWQPELLVVAAYGQILSKEVLSVPPRGGVNVHASLLPKYRGAAPIAWAIYHGETRTGLTIIRMTTGLDAGDMLAQQAVEIGPSETAGEVESRLAPLGARLALDVIDRLEAGPVEGRKQDPSQVTKAPKLKKEDGLIQWDRTAEQVCNQIRAMQPWPTAYTFLHRAGQSPLRLIITKAAPFPVRYAPDVPLGSLFTAESHPQSLFVTAGLVHPEERSVVEVYELQPAGKRRMAAEEFLRGRRPRPGDCLGPETP
jgi:methionyl-tRNA formyltransferase